MSWVTLLGCAWLAACSIKDFEVGTEVSPATRCDPDAGCPPASGEDGEDDVGEHEDAIDGGGDGDGELSAPTRDGDASARDGDGDEAPSSSDGGGDAMSAACGGTVDCHVGDVQTEPNSCGRCGTRMRTRSCEADCTWSGWSDPGACQGEGPCSPAEEQTRRLACGWCGTRQERSTCDDSCQWTGWTPDDACLGQGQCQAGGTDTERRECACGADETRARECNSGCGWGAWSDWSGCTVSLDTPDPCESLRQMTWTPAIDGQLECGLTLTGVTPQGWSESQAPIPSGNSARYAAAWHPKGLYVFVEVTDPDRDPAPSEAATYCGDAVEIYLDLDGSVALGNYDYPGTGQLIFPAPLAGGGRSSRVDGHAHPNGDYKQWSIEDKRYLGAFPTPTGYVVEALVTAEAINTSAMSIGARLGFSLGVHVSDSSGALTDLVDSKDTACQGDGRRLGQYFLRLGSGIGCTGAQPYCDTTAFCFPALE